ncbi:MAG: hypothetical protein HQL30_08215 [Candidatus Omnitrophica bacterium]|nr:hypothetical protein [Candidatus Omnitrophota bacterium]
MKKIKAIRAGLIFLAVTVIQGPVFSDEDGSGVTRGVKLENPYELDIESIYLQKADQPFYDSRLNLEKIFLSESASGWVPSSSSEPALDIEKDLLGEGRAVPGKNVRVTQAERKAMKSFIESSEDPIGSVFLEDGRKKKDVRYAQSADPTFEKVLLAAPSFGSAVTAGGADRSNVDPGKDLVPDAARVFLGVTWADDPETISGDKEPDLGKIFFANKAAVSAGSGAAAWTRTDGENILKEPDLVEAFLSAEYTSGVRAKSFDREPDLGKMLLAEKAASPAGDFTNAPVMPRIEGEDLLKDPDLLEAFLGAQYTTTVGVSVSDREPDLGKMLLAEKTAAPSGVFTSGPPPVKTRRSSRFIEPDPARVFLEALGEEKPASVKNDKEPDIGKIFFADGSVFLPGGLNVPGQTGQKPIGSVAASRPINEGAGVKKRSVGVVMDLEQVLLSGPYPGKKRSGMDLEHLFLSDNGGDKPGVDIEKLFLDKHVSPEGSGKVTGTVRSSGLSHPVQPGMSRSSSGGGIPQAVPRPRSSAPASSGKPDISALIGDDIPAGANPNTGVIISSGVAAEARPADNGVARKEPEQPKQGFVRGSVTEITDSSITIEESVFDKTIGKFVAMENTYFLSDDTELSNVESFRDIDLKSSAGIQYSELSGRKCAKTVVILPKKQIGTSPI